MPDRKRERWGELARHIGGEGCIGIPPGPMRADCPTGPAENQNREWGNALVPSRKFLGPIASGSHIFFRLSSATGKNRKQKRELSAVD